MELIRLSVKDFADTMTSDAPAPGGGSAAALAGALGAALAAMVASLTIGKKKYAEYEGSAKEMQARANELKDQLLIAVDKDTEAFNVISDAFSMPKSTDEEKAARSAAIQAGLVACVESPLQIMTYASEALHLIEGAIGRFNTSAASDLGVAVLELRTAVLGAWLNVLINLGSMKDKEKAACYRKAGEEMLGGLIPLADRLFEEIAQICEG